MTLAWHIVKKDLRLLRWTLLAWLALSLFDGLNRVAGPRLELGTDPWSWTRTLPFWMFLIATAYALVMLLFVANLIQAERLVGTTAFWLTRPIPRGTLLGSKLIGLALFVILPGLVIEGLLMMSFGVSAPTLAQALLDQTGFMAMLCLLLAFGASLTTTAARLLALCVSVLVGLYVVLLLSIGLAMPSIGRYDADAVAPARPGDPTQWMVTLTAFTIAVCLTLGYHYLRRRRGVAIIIFFAGVGVTWAVGEVVGPSISFFGGEPTVAQEPWARDPALCYMRTVPGGFNWQTSDSGRTESGGRGVIASLVVPMELYGLPPAYTAQPFTTDAQIRFADGHVLRSWRSRPQPVHPLVTPSHNGPKADDYVRDDFWPVLMRAPQAAVKQDSDRPGEYVGTFDYTLERHDVLATMPLAVNARYNDGARSVLITGLRTVQERCIATVRTTKVGLPADLLSRVVLAPRFRLRNGTALKDLPGNGAYGGAMGASVGAMFLPMPQPPRPFELGYHEVSVIYPMLDTNHAPGPPCDQIDVLMERRTYAGTLTRTLTLHDFRLDDGHPGLWAR